mmetsp:Transcript_121395/g.338847  ORF Transcript_121395/g.338847 Transcript_121395/m.338847 type:complete len:254 (+) Transcript_121395:382-1143(+)
MPWQGASAVPSCVPHRAPAAPPRPPVQLPPWKPCPARWAKAAQRPEGRRHPTSAAHEAPSAAGSWWQATAPQRQRPAGWTHDGRRGPGRSPTPRRPRRSQAPAARAAPVRLTVPAHRLPRARPARAVLRLLRRPRRRSSRAGPRPTRASAWRLQPRCWLTGPPALLGSAPGAAASPRPRSPAPRAAPSGPGRARTGRPGPFHTRHRLGQHLHEAPKDPTVAVSSRESAGPQGRAMLRLAFGKDRDSGCVSSPC